jgi:MFS transporter, FHS family, L-fucose permease
LAGVNRVSYEKLQPAHLTRMAANTTTVPVPHPTRSRRGALALVTTLFFMWGFLTALNDILVPHFKHLFDLNYAQVMRVQFWFFSTYFISSLPSGRLIDWIGYKKTMVVGLFTMGVGALLFIPAAAVPSFPLFLVSLVILAAGITALQVAANPYVTVLGPAKTASSRLNLTQAFNSLGTWLAPLFGSFLILAPDSKSLDEIHRMSAAARQAYRLHEAASVKIPYLGLGLTLIALAMVIAGSKLPSIPEAMRHGASSTSKGKDVLWKHRHLVLGAIAIFVYVGAEVGIGSFLVNYFTEPNIGAIPPNIAARYVSFYWGGAMVGRFIGSGILQKVRTGTLLGIAAIGAFLLVVTSMLTTGQVAMGSILLVGLFNSTMFPSIFALGVAELGPLTGDGSSVLVMAIVGGAIIPLLGGFLADRLGVQHAFILPALCYLYILFYGFQGSKPTQGLKAPA